MLKIRAQLPPIIFFDPERGQSGRDGFQNHGVDILLPKPLLFGQRLDDDGSDVRGLRFVIA